MNIGSTEAATARQVAVAAIRARVALTIGSWVKDPECIQMATACAMRESADMLEFLFSGTVAKEALKHSKGLMMTIGEWNALFGAHSRANRTTPVEELCAAECFQQPIRNVQGALRCTVEERDIAPQWARPVTKAACVFAMHTENHEDFLESALGSVVKADARRLDDLREQLEQEGTDTMTMAAAIVALAEIVT
jgi:hypothetical protein